MLAENEFEVQEEHLPGRSSRPVSKARDKSSVTILVPTLFEMSKAIMKMRCNLDKEGADEGVLDAFSKVEYALVKLTVDMEYLRRRGH